MAQIQTSVQIGRPVPDVFEFVTTPANWLIWHPSSVSITGATDHSLETGEQVTEEFVVAGKSGSVTWTVVEREAPSRWVISGKVAGAGGGDIAYSLLEGDRGTHFERVFTYKMSNWFLSLLDWLFIRRRIEAESREALRRLKRALESPASAGP